MQTIGWESREEREYKRLWASPRPWLSRATVYWESLVVAMASLVHTCEVIWINPTHSPSSSDGPSLSLFLVFSPKIDKHSIRNAELSSHVPFTPIFLYFMKFKYMWVSFFNCFWQNPLIFLFGLLWPLMLIIRITPWLIFLFNPFSFLLLELISTHSSPLGSACFRLLGVEMFCNGIFDFLTIACNHILLRQKYTYGHAHEVQMSRME